MPSDQIVAIAFAGDGTLYAGTQCDGLAIAKGPAYHTWRTVRGPAEPPLTPTGAGLPTNLINDVLVAGDGSVWVATTTGLAVSRNQGRSWTYVRGADWAQKVMDRHGGPPPGWTPPESATLAEDYVTALAQDATGNLWGLIEGDVALHGSLSVG